MPPRSLRRGDRQPMPGAVRKGCPRPKALRFASPFGGASPFGDGSYSGNILQGGVPLQPQDYLLDGVTPLPHCIVVTSTATVASDAQTGAAAFTCRNLVGIGAAVSLSASTNCKGLLGFVRGMAALRGGAHWHMDRLGRAGNFGDLSPADLLPARVRGRVSLERLLPYRVKARGAEGGAASSLSYGNGECYGNSGLAAGAMRTGGGGGGQAVNANTLGPGCRGGSGGCGGPCCGGAGGAPGYCQGSGGNAGDFGGPGGDTTAPNWGQVSAVAGGGGDPAGINNITPTYTFTIAQASAGGGLFLLFATQLDVGSGCLISADGSPGTVITGGPYGAVNGPGCGGGCVCIVTEPGGYHNSGTVRAAGGVHGDKQPYYVSTAGDGGAGSVNIFELAA